MIGWSTLRAPMMVAPMFLVSGPDLVIAACRAGIIGSFPTANPRHPESLEVWLDLIRNAQRDSESRGEVFAPYCVNVRPPVGSEKDKREKALLTLAEYAVPLVHTNLGDPRDVVDAAHEWGGRVVHDVATIRHAEKAAESGADCLMLVCAGAGGHAGTLSPLAFLPQVRRFFDGPIMLAGGIGDSNAVAAALALGADIAVMGTRFIATQESMAADAHKELLVSASTADVIYTDAISGLPASFLRQSIIANGLDPEALPAPLGRHKPNLPAGVKPWKGVFSGGHSTGLIDDVPTVRTVVDRLIDELSATAQPDRWRETLLRRTERL
ncbi:NAD(P)H-dependent flavin oxidoreductase [Rhodococcus koreensis]